MTPRRRALPPPRRAKLTTVQRGYGAPHKQMRERVRKIVEAGGATCARCRRPIHPAAAWHLDHTDDRTGYLGPSHAFCNVSAAQLRKQGRGGQRIIPTPSRRSRPRALGFFDTRSAES